MSPSRPTASTVLETSWRATHPVPHYDVGKSFYNQSTYFGRLRHFFSLIDLRNVFVSDSQILAAKEKIDRFKIGKTNGTTVPETDREMWAAQKLVDVGIHPETGNLIPRLGRMAMFLPANVPIAFGMLTSNSVPGTVFWQWVNQSYNAFFNFSNSATGFSGSNDRSDSVYGKIKSLANNEMTHAYLLATGASCGIALTLRKFKGFSSLPWLVPYVSVASAGSLNNFFMRRNELVTGVTVRDASNGNAVGTSKTAAKFGLASTILTRSILLPLPLLALPGVFMRLLNLGWHAKRTRWMALTAEVACITAAVGVALPACVAALPQTLELPVKWLEPEFQIKGREKLTVNRGV